MAGEGDATTVQRAIGRRRSTTGIAVALVTVALASGCSRELSFRSDDSIRFVSPAARAETSLPLRIAWRDERPIAGAARYGVFVDRSPIRPGASLRDVAGDDEVCRRTPGCPDAEYLARLRVYVTSRPEVVLASLPDDRPPGNRSQRDRHEVTVVRLVGDRRVGEAAFTRQFFVEREATS